MSAQRGTHLLDEATGVVAPSTGAHLLDEATGVGVALTTGAHL